MFDAIAFELSYDSPTSVCLLRLTKYDDVIATVVEHLARIEHDDVTVQPGGELAIVA